MNIVCKYRYSRCYLYGVCRNDYDCRECDCYEQKEYKDKKGPDGKLIAVYDPDCRRRETARHIFSKNCKNFDYVEGHGLAIGKEFIRDDDIEFLQIGSEVLKGADK